MNREEIREEIKEVFADDILLSFWTHEKCPPNIDGWELKDCQLDKDIKHERCMPCWKSWVDALVEQIIQALHSQGCVIKVDRELPNKYAIADFGGGLGLDSTPLFDKDGIKEAGYVAVEPLVEE